LFLFYQFAYFVYPDIIIILLPVICKEGLWRNGAFCGIIVYSLKCFMIYGSQKVIKTNSQARSFNNKAGSDWRGRIWNSNIFSFFLVILLILSFVKVSKEVINAFPNLKLIVARSTGYDHIDLKEAAKRKICVTSVIGVTISGNALSLILMTSALDFFLKSFSKCSCRFSSFPFVRKNITTELSFTELLIIL